jgi:hypothetical protein
MRASRAREGRNLIANLFGVAVLGLASMVGHTLAEGVFEVVIRGIGYLICRTLVRKVDPEGVLVFVVGLLAWGTVAFAVFLVARRI